MRGLRHHASDQSIPHSLPLHHGPSSDKIKASITTTTSTHGLSPPAFLPCPQLSCSFRSPASSSLSAPAQYNLVPKLSLSKPQDPPTAPPNSSLRTVSDTPPLAHLTYLPANYTEKFKAHNSKPTHFEVVALEWWFSPSHAHMKPSSAHGQLLFDSSPFYSPIYPVINYMNPAQLLMLYLSFVFTDTQASGEKLRPGPSKQVI